MLEQATLTISGEDHLLICAPEMASMVAAGEVMAITTLTLS